MVELPVEVATTIGENATYQLKQLISRAIKFMIHARRTRLTCADINKALKWSDIQPVHGHECDPNRILPYSYCDEAQIFKYDDEIVDLKDRVRTKSMLNDIALDEAVPEIIIDSLVEAREK